MLTKFSSLIMIFLGISMTWRCKWQSSWMNSQLHQSSASAELISIESSSLNATLSWRWRWGSIDRIFWWTSFQLENRSWHQTEIWLRSHQLTSMIIIQLIINSSFGTQIEWISWGWSLLSADQRCWRPIHHENDIKWVDPSIKSEFIMHLDMNFDEVSDHELRSEIWMDHHGK